MHLTYLQQDEVRFFQLGHNLKGSSPATLFHSKSYDRILMVFYYEKSVKASFKLGLKNVLFFSLTSVFIIATKVCVRKFQVVSNHSAVKFIPCFSLPIIWIPETPNKTFTVRSSQYSKSCFSKTKGPISSVKN